MKKLFVIQTNYIPWKGYFDALNMVDEVVLYDTMQYTKNDWRNRNQIKTAQGLQWLTIPIDVKGKLHQRINEATVSEAYHDWREKHWKAIQLNYSKAPYFKNYASLFENLYKNDTETNLSKINYSFISLINSILGIKTKLTWSTDFELKGDKNERIIELCKATDSKEYFSGPAAKDYIDTSLFEKEDIKLSYLDYTYPPYNQLYGEFIHAVSIIDLIFNEGPNMHKYMKSFL
jgi:hypothetical protein